MVGLGVGEEVAAAFWGIVQGRRAVERGGAGSG